MSSGEDSILNLDAFDGSSARAARSRAMGPIPCGQYRRRMCRCFRTVNRTVVHGGNLSHPMIMPRRNVGWRIAYICTRYYSRVTGTVEAGRYPSDDRHMGAHTPQEVLPADDC